MTYFPESIIITTIDGIQFKTFSNEHPPGFIIAKPKYIPIREIFSNRMLLTNIFNGENNRLNFWIDKKELKCYLDSFSRSYPFYRFFSKDHKTWFFAIPENRVRQAFDPSAGLKKLLSLQESDLDGHLAAVVRFAKFLGKSGVPLSDLGVTFSTLVGYYDDRYSDLNIVIYGKENGWKVINFLEKASHPSLKWKNKSQWEDFRKKRNRSKIFSEEEFFQQMSRKRTEGYFENILFVLFPVEKEKETWQEWGSEEYEPLGISEVEGFVEDNTDSIFRPGRFKIKNSKVISGENKKVKEIVFYSRDYTLQAMKGEKIRACGLLEKVTEKKTKKIHHRLVVGYFDSYLNTRREKEYIKTIK